jgi:RNA polymerase-interacting CarD/CdnL/TRCF family regulator
MVLGPTTVNYAGNSVGFPRNAQGRTFAGMTVPQLQALLTQAQLALGNLLTGASVVTVSYNAGEGGRSVTYRAANESALRALIQELQAALGLTKRRAIAVAFL